MCIRDRHCGCLESENVIFNDKNFIGYFTKFKRRRIKDGIEFDDTVTPVSYTHLTLPTSDLV